MPEEKLIFDFGFTAIDESELDAYQLAQDAQNQLKDASGTAEELQARLESMFTAIQPLLNNLRADRDKDYIYWKGEDRFQKIEQFSDRLDAIYAGNTDS